MRQGASHFRLLPSLSQLQGLIVDSRPPGQTEAFFGGDVARRRLRIGAGFSRVGCRSRFACMACLPMVACWSRSPDLGRIWCALVLYLVTAPLRWQEVQLSTRQGRDISENKASVLPLRLVRLQSSCNRCLGTLPSTACPWWMAWREGGSEGGFFNKLEAMRCVEIWESVSCLVFFSHHGGGEGGVWSAALHRSARLGAATISGDCQLRSSSASVIQGHRGHSVLRCCKRGGFFNLQARPFSDSVMALIASPTPSGFVPGGGADGRDVERIFILGGQGPDCVPISLLEVLFVFLEDLVVFSFPCKVLDVLCVSTE